MRRVLLVLFTALLAMPALGQSDRIQVTMQAIHPYAGRGVERVPLNTAITYNIRVFSDSPIGRDAEVLLEIPGRVTAVDTGHSQIGCPVPETQPIRCTIAVPDGLMLDATIRVQSRVETEGGFTAVARVGDQVATYTFEVVDRPSLSITLRTLGLLIEAGQTFRVESLLSSGGADASDVEWTYTLPAGGTFLSARPNDPETQCSVTAQQVRCSRATMPFGLAVRTDLEVRTPGNPTGRSVITHVEVSQDGPDFDFGDNRADSEISLFRRLAVTNTNDKGEGSLRQALLDAQAFCANTPCAWSSPSPGRPRTASSRSGRSRSCRKCGGG